MGQLKFTSSRGKTLLRSSPSCTTPEETSGHTSLHSPQAGVSPKHNVCQFCPARRPRKEARTQEKKTVSLHFCHWKESTPHYFLERGFSPGDMIAHQVSMYSLKLYARCCAQVNSSGGEDLWLLLISPNIQ